MTQKVASDALPLPIRLGGLIAGPALALLLYFSGLPAGLGPEGRIVSALALWMAIWWMSEAQPLAVTSLLPLVVLPLTHTLPFEKAVAPFASTIIFLFLGGFILSAAMQKWRLHRRIALLLLRFSGTSPAAVLGGVMATAGFLAFWMSNTATAVMMLPLALSMAALLTGTEADRAALAKALALGVAYAAAIGGLGTFVGTPTNAILQGFMSKTYGHEISLLQWMQFGVPAVVLILSAAWVILAQQCLKHARTAPDAQAKLAAELAALGPVQRGEKRVIAVFALCIFLWLAGDSMGLGLNDAAVAILGATLLLTLPLSLRRMEFTLSWKEAEQIPWGVLVFFGGSLSLSAALTQTGVTAWLGQELAVFSGLPLWLLVLGVVVLIIFVSELMSNVATITAFLPILAGLAEALKVDPLLLLVPATLAASCGFMMPGASAPNALAFSSGYLRVPEMVRAGILLDVVSAVIILLVSLAFLPFIFAL